MKRNRREAGMTMTEVMLADRETFLGRRVTSVWLGSMLAVISSFFLILALVVAWQTFVVGSAAVFNPDHPMVRLDRLASFSISLIALGSKAVGGSITTNAIT